MGLHRTRLLGNTADLLDAFFEDVSKASRRVWVECFIFRADRLGMWLADALAAAAARGVDVRLLYDPMGCRATDPQYFVDLGQRGVDVCSYGRNVSHQISRLLPRARNHSRLYVIDDVAYTGGQAWGDEWLPLDRGGYGWQDVCCRVEGPVVEDMAQLFERRLREAHGTPTMLDYDTQDRYDDIRLISDAPNRESLLYNAYLAAFARARRRIWLANSYCFPPRDLLLTLTEAARRGVDVRLLIPGKSDIPLIRRAARAEYADWMEQGLHVWEYQDRVMHSKYCLCDDSWCSIGTFNANAASLSVSIETALLSVDRGLCAEVAQQLEVDFSHSVEIGTADLARLGFRQRVLDSLAHAVMSAGDAILDPHPFRPRRAGRRADAHSVAGGKDHAPGEQRYRRGVVGRVLR
jgi:cardiolipin synthase A/B